MRWILLALLALLIPCQTVFANQTLKVAVNIGPPWAFYEEKQGVIGIDVDIITHVLNSLGYDAEFHLLAYSRLINDFNAGKYDIASPAAFESDVGSLSDAYLPFKDVAISLKRKNFDIDNVEDLKGKTIVAYQSATQVLGEKFADVVQNENYLELVEREIQIKLLVNERTDVVVGECRLLSYIVQKNYPNIEVVIHPIFRQISYGAIIQAPVLQQQFNRELKNMMASGRLQEILSRWP